MGITTEQDQTGRDLLVRMMNARENEAARISRFLHDEVGQVLSAVGLQLDLLRMDIEDGVQSGAARIGEIQKLLEQAVAHVRELSYELNPAVVERTGLGFALDRLVGRFRKDFPGSIRLFFDNSIRLPASVAGPVYKIAEQALGNAVRYAGASRIEVIFKRSRNNATLEVKDDGAASSDSEMNRQSRELAIHIMQYHAAQSGLNFTVESSKENGTIVKTVYRISE